MLTFRSRSTPDTGRGEVLAVEAAGGGEAQHGPRPPQGLPPWCQAEQAEGFRAGHRQVAPGQCPAARTPAPQWAGSQASAQNECLMGERVS